MSWRTQNVLSLLMVAAASFSLLAGYPQGKP